MGSICSKNNYNQMSSSGKKKKKVEKVADLDETMEDGSSALSCGNLQDIIQKEHCSTQRANTRWNGLKGRETAGVCGNCCILWCEENHE